MEFCRNLTISKIYYFHVMPYIAALTEYNAGRAFCIFIEVSNLLTADPVPIYFKWAGT